MERRVPARLSPAEGRRFGLTVGAAFVALAGALWWRGHDAAAPVPAALGTLLGLAGLVRPARLGPLQRAYFGVIAPMGLLLRVSRRNALRRLPSQPSFWIPREASARRRRDMERLF